MGNTIGIDFSDLSEDEISELEEADAVPNELRQRISNAIGSMVSELVGTYQLYGRTEMPIIRKKPDLKAFRHTMLFKEIKALCGLPPSDRRPNDHWSLTRGLMKRENGLGARPAGSFSLNQRRRISNLFVPNKKEERLMSLEAKVFISKFNKDGSKLITACQDSIVRIFDSSKGTYHRINRITANDINWSILDVDFSPCGKYFAYSTWSDNFYIVPVDGNNEDIQTVNLNTNPNRTGVFSLRFSPCGQYLIGSCNNSCIYMYDREKGNVKTIKTQRHSTVDINALSYIRDYDTNVFLSGCNNGVLKLWDDRCLGSVNRCSTPVSTFIGHLDGITYIDPRNDGHYVLTNSKDQSIKIWDLRQPSPVTKVNKHSNFPLIDWDYRWDTVPREYYNPTTTTDGDASVVTFRGHRVTKSLLRAKFSPAAQTGQRYIYTGCGTGRIIIYDVLTGYIKEAIEGHKDIVRDLAWHPVRSEIVSSSWDSHVNLNTFKRNPLLKRSELDRRRLRRSRRIAHRNGELEEDEDDEQPVVW